MSSEIDRFLFIEGSADQVVAGARDRVGGRLYLTDWRIEPNDSTPDPDSRLKIS